MPSEARNLSLAETQNKEGFLTPRTPFGMTGWRNFGNSADSVPSCGGQAE